jgi:hypothetical protein
MIGSSDERIAVLEARVRAMIAVCLTLILVFSVLAIIFGVLFVEHDMDRISPIDTQLISILKDIMLLAIGAVGGIVGSKSVAAVTKLEKPDAPSPDSTPAVRQQDS